MAISHFDKNVVKFQILKLLQVSRPDAAYRLHACNILSHNVTD